MSRVKVHPADSGYVVRSEVVAAIGARAYQLYEQRGCVAGKELDDWLQAEREVLFHPHVEVSENDESFRMTISTPGFVAKEVGVVAFPRELLVEAKTELQIELRQGRLEPREICQRILLHAPIAPEEVTARIDEGSLTIVAPKSMQREQSRFAAA